LESSGTPAVSLFSSVSPAERRIFVEKMSSFVLKLLNNSNPTLTARSFTENQQVANAIMELNLATIGVDELVEYFSPDAPLSKMEKWLSTDWQKVDWSVCPVDLTAEEASKYYGELLRNDLAFAPNAEIKVKSGAPYFNLSFRISPQTLEEADFFLHWGKSNSNEVWWSQEVKPTEIRQISESTYHIDSKILADIPGDYKITLHARHALSSEPIWLGRPAIDDLSFNIVKDIPTLL